MTKAATPETLDPSVPRPRCSVFIAASLDGFIAATDGGLGWLSVVESPGEDYGYARFAATIDTLVVGRRTYDTVLGFPSWPYEGKRCVVMTHAPPSPRHGEEFHTGTPSALLRRLGAEGVRHVYVDGGAVIRDFLAAGFIDELTLSIIPVLLGQGIPLFGAEGPTERRLRLTTSRSFPSGLVQVTYTLGGAPQP